MANNDKISKIWSYYRDTKKKIMASEVLRDVNTINLC